MSVRESSRDLQKVFENESSSKISKQHRDDKEVEELTTQVNRMLKRGHKNVWSAADVDSMKLLLDSITKKPRFSRMVEYSIDCLAKMVKDDVSAESMMESNAVSVLLSVMKTHPFNEKIQRSINRAFTAIARTDDLLGKFADSSVTEQLMNSLKNHQEGETHISTCALLSKLVGDPTRAESFVRRGGIDAIASILDDHDQFPEVCSAALKVLNSVTSIDPEVQKKIYDSSLLEKIVDSLGTHSVHNEASKEALLFLSKASKSNLGLKSLNKLDKETVIEKAVSVMEKYPDESYVLIDGAQLLDTLAQEHEIEKTLDILQKGNSADGSSILDNVDVSDDENASSVLERRLEEQELALSKISNLLLTDRNCQKVLERDGLSLLVDVLHSNSKEENTPFEIRKRIVETSCRAISRVCQMIPSQVSQFFQNEKAFTALTSVFVSCESDVGSLAEAVHLLAVGLNESSVQTPKLVLLEILPSFLENITLHAANLKFAQNTIAVFNNVVLNPDSKSAFKELGGFQRILDVLVAHANNPDLAAQTIQAISAYCDESSLMKMFFEAEGIVVALEILKAYPDNLRFAHQLVMLVDRALGDNFEWSKILIDLDFVDLVQQVLAQEHITQDLRDVCSSLLSSLAHLSGASTITKQLEFIVGELQEINAEDLEKKSEKSSDLVHASRVLMECVNVNLLDEADVKIDQIECVEAALNVFKVGSTLPKAIESRTEILDNSIHTLAKVFFKLDSVLVSPEALKRIDIPDLSSMVNYVIQSSVNNEIVFEEVISLANALIVTEENAHKIAQSDIIPKLVRHARECNLSERSLKKFVVSISQLVHVDETIVPILLEEETSELVVDAFFAKPDDSNHAFNSLNLLTMLAVDERSVTTLYNAGALEVAVAAFKRYPDDMDLHGVSMDLFLRMSHSPEALDLMRKNHWASKFLNSMSHFPESEELSAIGVDLLTTLAASSPEIIEEIVGIVDSITIIEAAVQDHPNRSVRKRGIQLLELVSQHVSKDAIVLHFDESRIAPKMQNMLQSLEAFSNVDIPECQVMLAEIDEMSTNIFSATKVVQEGGLKVLSIISREIAMDPSMRVTLSSTFHNIMNHMSEDILQISEVEPVIEVIGNIYSFDYVMQMSHSDLMSYLRHICVVSKAKESRAKLLSLGIAEILLEIWSRFLEQEEILILISQALGFYARERIIVNAIQSDDEHEKLSIPIILGLIAEHSKNPGVLEKLIYFVSQLCRSQAICLVVCKHEGIELISGIMENFDSSDKVMLACLKFLSNISFDCPAAIERISLSSAFGASINLNENLKELPIFLELSATVICNVCYDNTRTAIMAAQFGATSFLIEMLLKNYDNVTVLMAGFRALGNISFYGPNATVAIKDGAMQAIVAGLMFHSTRVDVVEVCLGVLTNLAADLNPETQSIIAEEGAVQAVVETAKKHASNVEITSASYGCLGNMMVDSTNARLFVQQRGLQLFCKTMRYFGSNIELMELVSSALFRISIVDRNKLKIAKIKDFGALILEAITRFEKATPPSISINFLRAITNTCSDRRAAGLFVQDVRP